MGVDAELAPAGQAVAQAALRQAIEGQCAARLDVRAGLQARLGRQVVGQPRRAHRARRQAGDADELDQVFVARLRQHLLEARVGIALVGGDEGRAELRRRGAECLHPGDVFEAADAPGGNQRHLALEAGAAQEGQRLWNHVFEIEARVAEISHLGRSEVAAGPARVLDDDRVGHALLALPLLHHQGHAAGVGQDRDQRGAWVLARQIGQVQRQAGADHHRVDAGLQRAGDRGCVLLDRAHHVDRQQPAALRQCPRGGDFATQGFEVGGVDRLLGRRADAQVAGALHQVGVMPAQIDRRDRAHRALCGNTARQAVRRHAHAHAALHDGQQLAPGQAQRAQAAGG